MSANLKILDAILLLAKDAINKAKYNRTITATIVSCVDPTIGKYKCRFQDSLIYAYSSSAEVTYSQGTSVYILVPDNNMKLQKTIIGTADRLGVNYITEIAEEYKYQPVGSNALKGIDKIELCTQANSGKGQEKVVYTAAASSDLIKNIGISDSIMLAATFKTNIAKLAQFYGHFGIRIELTYDIKINETDNLVRIYTLDENDMIGRPYNQENPTRQYKIFPIDADKLIGIKVVAFCSDFPKLEVALAPVDITISNWELYGVNPLEVEEIDGVAVSLIATKGNRITETNPTGNNIPITARVTIKGQLASPNEQKIKYFWGIENVSVNTINNKYNKYLGRGWLCVNKVLTVDAGNQSRVEWIPAGNSYKFAKSYFKAKETKIKVAVLYDKKVYTKLTIIYNDGKANLVTIVAGEGSADAIRKLQCNINSEYILPLDPEEQTKTTQTTDEDGTVIITEVTTNITYLVIYSWAKITQTGTYENLTNNSYSNKNGKWPIKTDESGNLVKDENDNPVNDTIAKIKLIYNIALTSVTNTLTYKCTILLRKTTKVTTVITTQKENNKETETKETKTVEDDILGTASVQLTNSIKGKSNLRLVITNGDIVFKYDESGIAPNSQSLEDPIEIKPLSFIFYDKKGKDITEKAIKDPDSSIQWDMPDSSTTLLLQGLDTSTNKKEFYYTIAKRYGYGKNNGQIKLTFKYKGVEYNAQTNFTFVQQGLPGTNGTDYVVRIVPNVSSGSPPRYVQLIQTKSYTNNGTLEFNFIPKETNYPFKVQLWYNGDMVLEGINADNLSTNELDSKPSISWEFLKQFGATSKTAFTIDINGKVSGITLTEKGPFTGWGANTNYLNNNYMNIIKCGINYNDKIYYGTLPITTVYRNNELYDILLLLNTGFLYILYNSDGSFPRYNDSRPFEIIIKKSKNNENEQDKWKFVWNKTGKDLIKLDKTKKDKDGKTLKDNQFWYKPKSTYDGESVDNAVQVIATKTLKNVTYYLKIHIPVHLLLNKYGFAHLNEWDGNSIQIDSGGGHILTPQVGAGKKEGENTFTGVLMGDVVTSDKKQQIGLFGFNKGQRTFFLDSDTGSAIFGVNNFSRIIIDPDGGGKIYGGGYYKEYKDNGLPKNYTNNFANKGMLIDLEKPLIKFGSGKFSVSSKGLLTAQGGGKIAGWNIGNETGINGSDQLSSKTIRLISGSKDYYPEGAIILAKKLTENGIIISTHRDKKNNLLPFISTLNNTDFTEPKEAGFYLSSLGLSLGKNFKVTNKGTMTSTGGTLKGKSTVENSTVKTSTIKENTMEDSGPAITTLKKKAIYTNADGVYIGGDGISLGKYFKVTKTGALRLGPGAVESLGSTEKGKHWVMSTNSELTAAYIGYNRYGGVANSPTQKTAVYMGTDGISLGDKFKVVETGTVRVGPGAVALKGRYWTISANGNEDAYIGYNRTRADGSSDGKDINGKSIINTTAVYLGTDGISLGQKFKVTNDGVLRVGAGATNNSGKHWIINGSSYSSYISYNAKNSKFYLAGSKTNNAYNNNANQVYIGTDGISLGNNFSVDDNGNLIARSGKIGNWLVKLDGDLVGYGARVTLADGRIENNVGYEMYLQPSRGRIYVGRRNAKGGLESVWYITPKGQMAGNYTMSGGASITSTGSGGTTKFGGSTGLTGSIGGDLALTGLGTLKLGGINAGVTTTDFSPGSINLPDPDHKGKTLDLTNWTEVHAKSVITDLLDVSKSFTYQNLTVSWRPLDVLVDVDYNFSRQTIITVNSYSIVNNKPVINSVGTERVLVPDSNSGSLLKKTFNHLYVLGTPITSGKWS